MNGEYFSQFGEDAWLFSNGHLPRHGFFCEVGAYDGLCGSNTLAFEKMGWTGILVEPDPEIAEQCQRNRKALTFACAIGAGRESDFLRVNPADRGTSGLGRPETGQNVMVPVIALDRLFWICGVKKVDLLSVDTEGTEVEVLRTLGSFRPTIVIAEFWTQPQPPRLAEIQSCCYHLGYRQIHQTEANAIFRKD